jgi:hypothetical protein
LFGIVSAPLSSHPRALDAVFSAGAAGQHMAIKPQPLPPGLLADF